jgi:pyrimidine-nucleoside phosphorylase
MIEQALANGSGLDVFRKMVEAHGGDPRVADDDGVLPTAPHRVLVEAESTGCVRAIDAERLGFLAVSMVAGRARAEDRVDPAVGIELSAPVGANVSVGAPLATLHVRDSDAAKPWIPIARSAFSIGRTRVKATSRVLGRLGTPGRSG